VARALPRGWFGLERARAVARALPRGWREGGWEAGERVGFREEEDAVGEEDKRGGKEREAGLEPEGSRERVWSVRKDCDRSNLGRSRPNSKCAGSISVRCPVREDCGETSKDFLRQRHDCLHRVVTWRSSGWACRSHSIVPSGRQ